MQISNPVQDGMKSRVRKGDLRFSGTSVPCHDKSKIVLPQKTNSSLNHKSRTQIKWSNANDTWLPPLSCDRSQDQVCAHGGSAVAHTTARSARFGQVSTSLLRGGFALNIFTPLDTTRHRHTRHAHNKHPQTKTTAHVSYMDLSSHRSPAPRVLASLGDNYAPRACGTRWRREAE